MNTKKKKKTWKEEKNCGWVHTRMRTHAHAFGLEDAEHVDGMVTDVE
jgi:hypothetical protein